MEELSPLKRIKSRTPKFFKIVRLIGLSIGAVGGAFMTGPDTLVVVGGYLVSIGAAVASVSTLAMSEGDPVSVKEVLLKELKMLNSKLGKSTSPRNKQKIEEKLNILNGMLSQIKKQQNE